MEFIRVARVDDVVLHKRGQMIHGSLHLTTHHLIFTVLSPKPNELRELWLCYPMISSVECSKGSALLRLLRQLQEEDGSRDDLSSSIVAQLPKLHNARGEELNLFKVSTIKINCKDFQFLSFDFVNEQECTDVFDSIMKLTCLTDTAQLYAFIYQPNPIERSFDSWNIYNPISEFERQGLNFNHTTQGSSSSWRASSINSNFKFCDTYPQTLIVPKTISDNVLIHASRFRSKNRIPALSYYNKTNGCTITRCSQPLVGLKQSRSIQDEKLVDEIFRSSDNSDTKVNILVDARPLTNAMAQFALGGGSENMDYYKKSEKVYLGIDNIHVMRDSLTQMCECLENVDVSSKLNRQDLNRSQWLKFLTLLLSSTEKLVKSFALNHSNILIHCSDGWDRTAQVSSLIQVCVDPYFRTIDGFITIVEKEWISFGHRFNERCGHLSSESIFRSQLDESNNALKTMSTRFKRKRALKFTSPVFQQFVDCIYQLLLQYPSEFQFNERFLRRLIYHLYSCQYGNFLHDNERERFTTQVRLKTRSVWDYFLSRRDEFSNKSFEPKEALIIPNYSKVKWWWQLYGRSDDEMNGTVVSSQRGNNAVANGNTGDTYNDSSEDKSLIVENKFQEMSVS